MDHIPSRDDDRFEEVLGRLDALMRRDQPPPGPPPLSPSENPIPVLTEIYVPAGTAENLQEDTSVVQGQLTADELMEQATAVVLPVMAQMIEDVLLSKIMPAVEGVIQQSLAELKPQLESLLRQHLTKQMSTQAGEDQTEM